jgi:hypothetical protein
MTEPLITVNGQELSEAQAMTVRNALEAFAAFLADNGLGNDGNGKRIADAYIARINEIRRMIFGVRRTADNQTGDK